MENRKFSLHEVAVAQLLGSRGIIYECTVASVWMNASGGWVSKIGQLIMPALAAMAFGSRLLPGLWVLETSDQAYSRVVRANVNY